jgi:hypothetical protein
MLAKISQLSRDKGGSIQLEFIRGVYYVPGNLLEGSTMSTVARVWLTVLCSLMLAMPVLITVAQARAGGAVP